MEDTLAHIAFVDEDEVQLVQVECEADRVSQRVALVRHGERADETVREDVEVGAFGGGQGFERASRLFGAKRKVGELLRRERFCDRCVRLGRLCQRHRSHACLQLVLGRHEKLLSEADDAWPAICARWQARPMPTRLARASAESARPRVPATPGPALALGANRPCVLCARAGIVLPIIGRAATQPFSSR